MKTAMQELIERLNNVKPQEFCSIETIKGWAESLLQKEKEQIIDAFITGDLFISDHVDGVNITAINYYNETYGSESKT